MDKKAKIEEMQKCADRHRAIHDWRQKLETRILFTTLSFYAAATLAFLKIGISNNDRVKFILSIAYASLAIVTSIFLRRLHFSNHLNIAISENYEAEINKMLELENNPIPKKFIKDDYDSMRPVKFFTSNWGWQTSVTVLFAFAGVLLIWTM